MFGLWAKNRAEWEIIDLACYQFGLTLIPLYDTYGLDSLEYCLDLTEINTLFITKDHVQKFLDLNKHA